ncbi:hypothetical protein GH714_028139 [Hevea brasiliensis]|uniref:Uncharacterized protein n=1 Tax=Hevea brasiliensis TaxID=3981 RepID=A0A6A6N356_HEVBR|nr:hypothetical protein GH714_028139 [Hevea brasiliensis]
MPLFSFNRNSDGGPIGEWYYGEMPPGKALSDSPIPTIIQQDEAYKAKIIGKEFCEAGGYPELETLSITSRDLVEWTEIVNGAFPSLRSLQFEFCRNLRFLPEGLQHISTIQELCYGDRMET